MFEKKKSINFVKCFFLFCRKLGISNFGKIYNRATLIIDLIILYDKWIASCRPDCIRDSFLSSIAALWGIYCSVWTRLVRGTPHTRAFSKHLQHNCIHRKQKKQLKQYELYYFNYLILCYKKEIKSQCFLQWNEKKEFLNKAEKCKVFLLVFRIRRLQFFRVAKEEKSRIQDTATKQGIKKIRHWYLGA